MNPRNAYIPGQALDPALHSIGSPVTFYHGHMVEAGQITRVNTQHEGGLLFDVRVVSGGTFRDIPLGDLNNPQPNTFTYAP